MRLKLKGTTLHSAWFKLKDTILCPGGKLRGTSERYLTSLFLMKVTLKGTTLNLQFNTKNVLSNISSAYPEKAITETGIFQDMWKILQNFLTCNLRSGGQCYETSLSVTYGFCIKLECLFLARLSRLVYPSEANFGAPL